MLDELSAAGPTGKYGALTGKSLSVKSCGLM